MLEEEGIIVDLVNGKAVVKAHRSDMCGSCSSSKSCHSEGEKVMIIEARNPVNAKVGQRVKIALTSGSVMYASIIIYVVPLISLFIGAITGKWVAIAVNYPINQELSEAVFAIVFLIASFLIIWACNKRIEGNPDFIPVITEILNGNLQIH
jgi:sigma-E factor negative regulatory protein RseC